jgi:hypothetical protein
MAANPQFGLDAVGDVISGVDGHLLPQARVIRRIVDETMFADALGVDVFHIGSTTAATRPDLRLRSYSRQCGTHQPNSPWLLSDGAQFGRSRLCFPALR